LVSEDVFCETATAIIGLFNDLMIQMCCLTLGLSFGIWDEFDSMFDDNCTPIPEIG